MSNISKYMENIKLDVIKLYTKDNLSYNAIAKKFNVSQPSIKKYLINWGVKQKPVYEQMSYVLHDRQKDDRCFPKNILNLLEGGLLGDGGVYNTKLQSYYQHGCINKDYIDFLKTYFNNNEIIANICSIAPKGKSVKRFYCLTTRSSLFLRNIRNKWYKGSIKIVPEDFELCPLSLKHWWIGDGYLNPDWGWATIATQSFTEKENMFLKNKLNNITEHYITLRPSGKAAPGKFHLYLSRKAINDLINYMGSCPVKSFKYKWKVKNGI